MKTMSMRSTRAEFATMPSVYTVDVLEETLNERIQHYLELHLHDNAIFLAERLVAHNRAEENLLQLATCYYRAGKVARAIAVLENAKRPENRYLLALCCFQQNKLVEAENALQSGESRPYMGNTISIENVPNGAAGMYLMGRICRRANRRQQAIDYFTKALEMDATLWSAYEELCDLGANIDSVKFFTAVPMLSDDFSSGPEDDFPVDNSKADGNSAYRTPQFRTPSTPRDTLARLSGTRHAVSTPAPLSYRTPNAANNYSTPAFGSPQEVVKKSRIGGINGAPNPRARKTYRRPLTETDEKQRRNARLSFSSAISEDSPQDFSKGDSGITPLATRLFQSNNSPAGSPKSKPTSQRKAHEGRTQLLQLLSAFGAIYQKNSVYMCREALELLDRLPKNQLSSGWAQLQIGRAHFELADYKQAQYVFRALYQGEQYRMAGLDLYSTTLWHLKKEVGLSYLAQQVTEFDKLSPEAWCVAGNCFSLQKEHDTALSFFQRSIQLDPYYTYAYTLSGHEYVANEDFEKAINCYRHAIRVDPRHYNAWYGLGTIYYRQEKFEFAEYHFRRALEINPRSSLLHCFLGMVLHSMQQFDEALDALAIASELQPLNPQARFQRANVLITLHRYDEAMEELNAVRNFAPRESSVHFMMGRVAKKLGRVDEAMRCFTTALYFHPKDNNIIKSAIDKINEPDLDDDDRL
ncbi:hypothetical protein Poli38472_000623 [Pythium oligandrum]|uniref:Uncharacterized protein n=1 Tax=Pythium oligandrum TaxID=41045 RepID=A0A8K1CCU8_PYTOL|nr:hypothetical protein Poli38472_000623 [Pythium oligandrum]|eukprot:TMW60581.1 hypothetical protein Poli38472_000623 [Pythium oligandrum]